MNLADLYSTLETVRRNAKGLLSNPTDTLNQWGSQIKEDLGQYDQGNARAMGLLSAGNPSAAADAALQNNMGIGTGAGLLGLHIAYHGTPATVDKFSMDKIGTGQGAQSYGHGLYFAENPATAKTYQELLGGMGIKYPTGETITANQATGAPSQAINLVHYHSATGATDPIAAAIQDIEQTPHRMQDSAGSLAWLRNWQDSNAKFGPAGNLYKVDINADPAHYLDWDKPLSQQSPKVQSALKTAYAQRGFPLDESGTPLAFARNPDGESLHAYLASSLQGTGNNSAGQAGASQVLRSLGVPGIKYKDAGSRGADTGTHNYVVFDDSLINNLGPQP